ncbi:MAG: Ger(x)C family spore germination protein [Clostridia bacterium]|nr:Ger(x)C family spore germination protein [Clostridia bacterium]
MKSKILFLLTVMFLLNGLNNARELNELAIVSAIGIDLDENGDYIITSQILNTKKENSSGSGSGSSSGSSEIVVFNSKSDNIQTALRNTIKESPRKLYLAHMELLLISEKVAKDKEILDTLNFFIRDNEGSNDFMLVVTKNSTPQEVLQITTPLESNPAQNIKDSILTTHRYKGIATDNILSDNISMFKRESQTSMVTAIEIDQQKKDSNNSEKQEENTQESSIENINQQEQSSDSNQNSNIKISGLCFFKYKTLSGYLENDESYIYNIIMDQADSGIISLGKGEDLMVIEQINSSSKLVPRIENTEYFIDISVDMSCNITETGKNVTLDTEQNIQYYEKQAGEFLKEKIEELIEKSKTVYDCDLFSLGNVFYKYKNNDYNHLKAKYGNDYFKHINTNVDVNITFPSEGGINHIW